MTNKLLRDRFQLLGSVGLRSQSGSVGADEGVVVDLRGSGGAQLRTPPLTGSDQKRIRLQYAELSTGGGHAAVREVKGYQVPWETSLLQYIANFA